MQLDVRHYSHPHDPSMAAQKSDHNVSPYIGGTYAFPSYYASAFGLESALGSGQNDSEYYTTNATTYGGSTSESLDTQASRAKNDPLGQQRAVEVFRKSPFRKPPVDRRGR